MNLRIACSIFLVAAALSLRAADGPDQDNAPETPGALHYLSAREPDVVALLAPPPLPDSREQAADMDEVRAVFHSASSNDVAIAYSQKKFSVFNFTPAVGGFFVSGDLPVTTDFFRHVQKDAATVTDGAKEYYKRPRPYVIDPTLANGKLEKSFSYPSGHSTESMVLALVLAELFPDKSGAIFSQAREIGWHRVQIARHYPTDIYAGRVLARAIVRDMKKNAEFQRDLAAARQEISAKVAAGSRDQATAIAGGVK